MNQTRLLRYIVAIAMILLVGFGCVSTPKKKQSKASAAKITWTFQTYAVKGGWGYYIFCNGDKMINQDQIPAIEGKHPFASDEQAKKTAQLVVEKLCKNKIPSVTKEELIKLGVIDASLVPIKKK